MIETIVTVVLTFLGAVLTVSLWRREGPRLKILAKHSFDKCSGPKWDLRVINMGRSVVTYVDWDVLIYENRLLRFLDVGGKPPSDTQVSGLEAAILPRDNSGGECIVDGDVQYYTKYYNKETKVIGPTEPRDFVITADPARYTDPPVLAFKIRHTIGKAKVQLKWPSYFI